MINQSKFLLNSHLQENDRLTLNEKVLYNNEIFIMFILVYIKIDWILIDISCVVNHDVGKLL